MDPVLHKETLIIDGGRELYSYTFGEEDAQAGNLTPAPAEGGEESL